MPRSWFLIHFSNKKELGIFEEMADSRTGVGTTQGEPGLSSHSAKK